MDQPLNGTRPSDESRNAGVIAAHIMCVIPDTHCTFRDEIRVFVQDAAYMAPELLRGKQCWLELERIMHKHVPEPDVEWKQRVIDFYVGTIQSLDVQEKPKPKHARRMTIDTNR